MRREIRTSALTLALAAAAVLIMLLASTGAAYADMSGQNGKTTPAAFVSIPVKHVITGNYSGSDSFEFILTARDDSCPMPEGSSGRTKMVTVKGDADPDFGTIRFEYPDAYYYAVSRTDTSIKGLETDMQTYAVMVAKLNDGSTDVVVWNSEGEKVDEITYRDSYTAKRLTPKTGDEEMRRAIIRWLIICTAAAAGLIIVLVASAAGSLMNARREERGGRQ